MADAQSADDFLGTGPSADDFLGPDAPTSTQSLLGPVSVAPAEPDAPGSDGNIKGMVRNLAGSNLVDGKERSILSKYADTVGGRGDYPYGHAR
jgi:hypothetical protein